MHGFVSCGKSAISQALSRKYAEKGRLPASFFFSRGSGDRSRMSKFAVTLASQMIAAIPSTRLFVKAAVKAEPALVTREISLPTQLERLVYKPFQAVVRRGLIFKTLLKGPFLIVIDGLDECEDKEEVKEFVEHLLDFFKRYPSTPLRFFITSRVEQHIRESLNTDGVLLDDLVTRGSNDDILTFLGTSFSVQAKRDPVIAAYIQSHGQWPTRKDMKRLVHHIGGSFIFASTAFKYIIGPSDDGLTPMTRLPLTLAMDPGLDGLYAYTLTRSQHLPHFSDVISTIALSFEPLPITGIAELLGIETFEVLHVLVNLQAIVHIHIPGTNNLPITLCHTSLRDFLTTENRSGCFFVPPSYHLHLLHRCSILIDKRESGTAATLYSIGRLQSHLEQCTCLPSWQQGSVSRFPPTLNDLYRKILENAQHLPHFLDIISTIGLLFEPLPVAGIAELLGITPIEVAQVLGNLRAILHIPESADLPVTLRHPSLHEFFTTPSSARRFFAPPSHHLHIIYRCVALKDERRSGHVTSAALYSNTFFEQHIEQLTCLPSIAQAKLPRFPHTIDALYAQILTRSQDLPHFHPIISAIVFLFEPLPISGIAELLGIGIAEVIHVLDNLQAIVHLSRTNDVDFPVTLCHASVRDFLATQSRSGNFFVPPSFHLYLSYRCWILRDQRRSGTAAASYNIGYSSQHLEQFTSLDPHDQGPVLHFPQTLDVLYAHILAKSQHLPHFSDIISTIVSCRRPLPIAGIAELLGIDASCASQVLIALQVIIPLVHQGGGDTLMAVCSKPLHDFLTNEVRSAPFFVSPTYHLKLAYSWFALYLKRQPDRLGEGPRPDDHVSLYQWKDHSKWFLQEVPEQDALAELGRLTNPVPPEVVRSHHIFLPALLFLWIFDRDIPRPRRALEILAKCSESLALALEFDPKPDRWLHVTFDNVCQGHLSIDTLKMRVHHHEVMALQRYIQRAEAMIRAKVNPHFFGIQAFCSNAEARTRAVS
jgi:hypothetical protein